MPARTSKTSISKTSTSKTTSSKKTELPQLLTTVDLSHPDANVYHFIYASQLYGTLFAMYAQFEGKKTDKGYAVSQINLKLVNYKGNINIGFTKDAATLDKSLAASDAVNIQFNVQGTSTIMDKTMTLSPAIVVAKGQRLPIHFSRTLVPLPDFQGYYKTRDGEITDEKLSEAPPIASLFDSEFNDRDGIDFYNRPLRPGMYPDSQKATAGTRGTRAAGPRCHQSNVNLYYS